MSESTAAPPGREDDEPLLELELRPYRSLSPQGFLILMLAVANSTFIERFYDARFHNKLYAGRRRFITQYVENFPLPDLDSDIGRKLAELAKELVSSPVQTEIEDEVDELVWQSFGLTVGER